VKPVPNLSPQYVSRHLQYQLLTEVELKGFGVVINAPVDLQLSPHDIMQPDWFSFRCIAKSILTSSKIKGVPDLVVEILSKSNTRHDTQVK
jgi:hypothetical protein